MLLLPTTPPEDLNILRKDPRAGGSFTWCLKLPFFTKQKRKTDVSFPHAEIILQELKLMYKYKVRIYLLWKYLMRDHPIMKIFLHRRLHWDYISSHITQQSARFLRQLEGSTDKPDWAYNLNGKENLLVHSIATPDHHTTTSTYVRWAFPFFLVSSQFLLGTPAWMPFLPSLFPFV